MYISTENTFKEESMQEILEVIRPCWDDILKGYREIEWTAEQLDYKVLKDGDSFIVRFTRIFYERALCEANKHNRKELVNFFSLRAEPDPESKNNVLVFAPQGWLELTQIQCAMGMALRELKIELEIQKEEEVRLEAEKRARERKEIGEQKIMLTLQLEDAMKNYKAFGFDKAHIKHKEDKYFATVFFKKKKTGTRLFPGSWKNRVEFTPLGILVEFKKYLQEKTLE